LTGAPVRIHDGHSTGLIACPRHTVRMPASRQAETAPIGGYRAP
jgi:hypothetical protein